MICAVCAARRRSELQSRCGPSAANTGAAAFDLGDPDLVEIDIAVPLAALLGVPIGLAMPDQHQTPTGFSRVAHDASGSSSLRSVTAVGGF